MYFMLSAICISLLLYSLFSRILICGTNAVCEMAHLYDQPVIVSEKSLSSIRFAAKCVLTCAALSVLLLSTTRYIRIIQPSSPCYIMRAADTRAWFNMQFNARQLIISLIVPYGYCVHNTHVIDEYYCRCRWHTKRYAYMNRISVLSYFVLKKRTIKIFSKKRYEERHMYITPVSYIHRYSV